MATEKERFEILLEDMNSKIDLLVEGMMGTNDRLDRLEQRVGNIENIVSKTPVLEVMVEDHEKRINVLEENVV